MGLQAGDKNVSIFSDLTEEVAESFRSSPKIISSSRLNAIVYYAFTMFNKSTSKHFRYSAGLLSGDYAQKSPSEKPFERVKKIPSKEVRSIICSLVEDFANADVEGMILKTSQEPSAMRRSLDPSVETTKRTAHKT